MHTDNRAIGGSIGTAEVGSILASHPGARGWVNGQTIHTSGRAIPNSGSGSPGACRR